MNYKLSKFMAWQEVPSKGYLFIKNCQNNYLYKFTEVSKDILLLLISGKSDYSIIKDLSDKYNVSVDILENDYYEFIDSLISEGLIVN